METTTAILLAAGAAGVGFIAYRNWQKGQPAAQQSPCAAVGALASAAASAYAPEDPTAGKNASQAAQLACTQFQKLSGTEKGIAALIGIGPALVPRALDYVTGKLYGNLDTGAVKKRNEELNGAIVERVDPRMERSFFNRFRHHIWNTLSKDPKTGKLGLDVPLRHVNGCVPYSGHAGAAKCVVGTRMLDGGANQYTAAMATGRADDPTTGRLAAGATFPLQVPAGSAAYWDRGEAKVCASLARDWRDGRGGTYVCQQPRAAYIGTRVGSASVDGVLVVDIRGDSPQRQVA